MATGLSAQFRFLDSGPEPIRLRDYQVSAIDSVRSSYLAGLRRVILQIPTGGGKTICASEIMRAAAEKGSYSLFLAHRRELINQCADKLWRFGVCNGIIMAGRRLDLAERVQVASIMTLWSRAVKRQVINIPRVDLIVIDECHLALAPTWRKLVDLFPEAYVLGLTATPIRADGKGLGNLFEAIVDGPSVAALTEQGHLVPVRYVSPPLRPDLDGVPIGSDGDYRTGGELQRRFDTKVLVGDVIENWLKWAADRPTVVFASGVKHSMHLAEEFRKAGVEAAHLDGDTPDDERDGMLSDLADGRLQVVTNCDVLIEGWDCPRVSCCVLARSTKSIRKYLQMGGRTLRPSPESGKVDCLLIDHAGIVGQPGFGFLDDPREWSLEGKSLGQSKAARKADKLPIICEKCFTIYRGRKDCPECGHAAPIRSKPVETVEGELVEIDRNGVARRSATSAEMADWYAQLLWICGNREYKPGWVANQFRDKFGIWPPREFAGVEPKRPGRAVDGWVRAQLRKFARRKEKENGEG